MSRTVTELDVKLGAAVRARRVGLGMSQGELARRLGVAFQQIQKYEAAKNRIAASTLVEIARHLDCSAASLLGMAETPFALDVQDVEMLQVWRRLDRQDQITALRLFRSLAGDSLEGDSDDPGSGAQTELAG